GIEKEANFLADFAYSKLHEFPDEEKWVTTQKLRISANDLMFYSAQAAANTSPSGAEYEWSNARKNANSFRTLYIFATKQNYIELEPEIVVRIDTLVRQIDDQSQQAQKLAEAANDKDLEHWRRKYKLWREMNNEN
ncbi:MAG TPA: hypothetical protein VK712_00175, partial [Verrucomicrobiae bacterium]|nr:hypothetical protein [Verrucomicrobiae bacterium]